MTQKDIFTAYQKCHQANVILSYYGPLNQCIIEEMGESIRSYMKFQNLPYSDIYRILNIFIEQTQNIIFHGEHHKTQNDIHSNQTGIALIEHTGKHYKIISGNIVSENKRKELNEKLSKIENLDKKELKKLFKYQLNQKVMPEQKGAGLGLIEMARKSKKPLKYCFTPYNPATHFFTLEVTV